MSKVSNDNKVSRRIKGEGTIRKRGREMTTILLTITTLLLMNGLKSG